MEMNQKKSLEKLSEAYHNPHIVSENTYRRNRQVIGCLSENVPLEIVYAADIIPVLIQGGDTDTMASMHLQQFTCSYARAAIHRAMSAEYEYLDGLIAAKTCDVGLSLFQIWSDLRSPKFNRLISLPGNCDAEAISYLRDELATFKAALEAYMGITISDEKLLESISLYNDLRAAGEKIWRYGSIDSKPLSASDIIKAIKGSQILPPSDSLEMLNSLIDEEGIERNDSDPDTPRIMLLGNSYADMSLIDIIEEQGARGAYDNTTSTGRYLGPNIEVKDDPLSALARHYACKVTGCYRLSYEERWQNIRDAIRKWDINSCIILVQKYCDTSLFEVPLVEASLSQINIPCITLEIDDTSPGISQMETRVQAFIEMIGGI